MANRRGLRSRTRLLLAAVVLASAWWGGTGSFGSTAFGQEATCEKNLAALLARFGELSDENKALRNDVQALREALGRLESQASSLRKENEELRHALDEVKAVRARLEEELAALRPKRLPPLTQEDLSGKNLVLKRVYTIRSGECFDHNGDRSCMVHEFLTPEGRKCYLVYKANRILSDDEAVRGIIDKSGRELRIVSRELSEKIRTWEKENPDLLPLLMTY